MWIILQPPETSQTCDNSLTWVTHLKTVNQSEKTSTLSKNPSKEDDSDDIVIKEEDVDMLVNELEMSQEEAEEALRKCKGDLAKVLKKFAGTASGYE